MQHDNSKCVIINLFTVAMGSSKQPTIRPDLPPAYHGDSDAASSSSAVLLADIDRHNEDEELPSYSDVAPYTDEPSAGSSSNGPRQSATPMELIIQGQTWNKYVFSPRPRSPLLMLSAVPLPSYPSPPTAVTAPKYTRTFQTTAPTPLPSIRCSANNHIHPPATSSSSLAPTPSRPKGTAKQSTKL